MTYLQIILAFLILTVSHAVKANSVHLDFVNQTMNQINYAESQQQAVWPGFHPASTPFIIQFEENNKKTAYALNFKPNLLPWEKIASSNYPLYFLANANALNLWQENDNQFLKIDGQNCYIDLETNGQLNVSKNFINKLMTKRASHYIKHEMSIDPKNLSFAEISYDSFNNTTLLKLFYLEDAALTFAAQVDTVRAEEALRDAVAIHQYRNQLLSPSAREFENGNEIFTGIPFFISLTSQQLSEEAYRQKTERAGCYPLTILGKKFIPNCITNLFPIFTSLIYGHALDQKLVGKPWKDNVEKQFKSISQMIIDYYHFDKTRAKKMTEQAIKKTEYHYDRIERIIDHLMLPYLKGMKIAKQKFDKLTGIEVETNFPIGVRLLALANFMHVYAESYMLNNNELLLEDLNLPKQDSDLDDAIVVNHFPYMLLRLIKKDFDIDLENAWTIFKLSEKAELIVDNVRMNVCDCINKKKTISFHQIVIVDSNLYLPLAGFGKLEFSEGVLKLISTSGSR